MPYPWKDKLQHALLETRRFTSQSHLLFQKCISEVQQLSEDLAKNSKFVFRDANIKNRLISFASESPTEDVRKWLTLTPSAHLVESLRTKTHDVDFETCRWLVTEWDDPFHLLSCPFIDLRASPNSHRRENLDFLKAWWRSPTTDEDAESMHATFLCRSLREFLRRLWFANVMPRRYLVRYGKEPRDHFLILARMYAGKVHSGSALEALLDECWDRRERLWNGIIGSRRADVLQVDPGTNRPNSTEVNLSSIAAGAAAASEYHCGAVSTLKDVFDGVLDYIDTEIPLHEGRKRVDAVFSNVAKSGFFHDLRNVLKCDYVFVECKNYSGQIGNAELDQLAGRFAAQRGKFGILCCRRIGNRKQVIRRCRDVWNDERGCIIVLDDGDLTALSQLARAFDYGGVSGYMKDRLREVTL